MQSWKTVLRASIPYTRVDPVRYTCDSSATTGEYWPTSGSCQTGFWTGTPAVVLPTFSERESNARRVAALGAGEMVAVAAGTDHVKTVDAQQLRRAVRRVLDDPRFAAAAAAVGEDLRTYGGPAAAADHVEELAAAG